MNKLKIKARSGVTLVELLVVILIVTILSVGLLPLLKPYIEQAKYAAEAIPALGNIQTKINLYQYERDKLPGTTGSTNAVASTWMKDDQASKGKIVVYKKAKLTGIDGASPSREVLGDSDSHISDFIDVDWQDLTGKRINPSQFQYAVIKGDGAAKYGYALGIFGNGEGVAKGTGYAILVLVDTTNKVKIIATWERYKPKADQNVNFKMSASGTIGDSECAIPNLNAITGATTVDSWKTIATRLKTAGWSFNFDDNADQ